MEPTSSFTHGHNSTLGRELAHCCYPPRYTTRTSEMEQTSCAHYDFATRKSTDPTSLTRPMAKRNSNMNDPYANRKMVNHNNNIAATGRDAMHHHNHHHCGPSSELIIPANWRQTQPNVSSLSYSSAVNEEQCAFNPPLAVPSTAEIHHREVCKSGLTEAAPFPYMTATQQPSCSCRDCMYYQKYYHNYPNHTASYYSPYRPPATSWTPVDQDRPIFRRRISDDSPRVAPPSVVVLTHNLANEGMGQNNRYRHGEDQGIVDPCDVEVEQITRRKRDYEQTLSHGQFEGPQLSQLASFPNQHYFGCYSYGYPTFPPLLQEASPISQYYHPYQPSHLPPVYYPNAFQDPAYMYSYYSNSFYHPESYPCYPVPMEDVNAPKRKRYDDFLLRPQKDYLIYADRCSSPMSDITASPTPSLSDFGEVEEMGRIDKEDLVVDVHSPLVPLDLVPPRIERMVVKDSSIAYTFEKKQGSKDVVRTVSPIKPKVVEEGTTRSEGGQRDIWIKEEVKNAAAINGENNYLATISNNISQSSSEQWEADDV